MDNFFCHLPNCHGFLAHGRRELHSVSHPQIIHLLCAGRVTRFSDFCDLIFQRIWSLYLDAHEPGDGALIHSLHHNHRDHETQLELRTE